MNVLTIDYPPDEMEKKIEEAEKEFDKFLKGEPNKLIIKEAMIIEG